jgi:hypothetical protein
VFDESDEDDAELELVLDDELELDESELLDEDEEEEDEVGDSLVAEPVEDVLLVLFSALLSLR